MLGYRLDQRPDRQRQVDDEGRLDQLRLDQLALQRVDQRRPVVVGLGILAGDLGELVAAGLGDVDAGLFLDQVLQPQPRPGRRQVDRLAVALDLGRPQHPFGDVGDDALGDVHHAVVIGAADEPLEHRELGVVLRRHPLVAEELAQLVDVLEAADDRPLQVELGGDPQVEVAVERVVVGLERPRRGAAGHPLQHRRFHLDVAAFVEVVADRRHHLGPHREDLARALVRHQVELALAVAHLRVGDAVEEVGRVAQRLGQQRALAHLDRQLAAFGHVEVALDPDQVADVEVFDPVERLLARARRRRA